MGYGMRGSENVNISLFVVVQCLGEVKKLNIWHLLPKSRYVQYAGKNFLDFGSYYELSKII